MSILARSRLVEEISAGRIRISPFDPECIGPASIDLHLSDAFRRFVAIDGPLRVDEHADYRAVTRGERVPAGESFLLRPTETVLGITTERITLPPDVCGWIEGRSRFARVGLLVHISASFMQPGLDNHQVLEISNFGTLDLALVPGTPICQFVFQRTEGEGQYQGRFRDQTPERFGAD